MKRLLALLVLVSALAGCAGSSGLDRSEIHDPLEAFNRATFASYLAVDKVALHPVANAYRDVVPGGVRRSVRNFLDNLHSPAVFANDVLQGRLKRSGNTLLRATINTTIGLGGLFDVAAKLRLPRHSNDFGTTLAIYGVREGAYLFVPLLGPSNVRDLSGTIVDILLDPIIVFDVRSPYSWLAAEYALQTADVRERNIETLDDLERTSVDFYATVRDIYRQSRANAIREGLGAVEELPDF